MPDLQIPVGLTLTEPIDKIHKKVLFAMRDELNRVITKAVPNIQTAIQNRSRVFFETSKEARALIHGPLNAHFGIPKGEEAYRVGAIIQTVINNIEVTSKKVSVLGYRLGGGITVGAIVADFSDVLNHPEATITTDKGEVLPWLHWLLLEGDRIIIADYNIRFGNYSSNKFNSRSEQAIMYKSGTGMWRVPPQYSGTANNNWLTRAIFDVSAAYVDMVGQVIQEKIEAAF